jgi:hypothetical protein
MSRFLVRLAISAAMSVSFARAMPAAEQDVSPRPLPSAGQAKILAALDQPTEFDFQDRPLGEVVNIFKETYEIEILLDRKALSDARIDRDAPITQTLKNISLRSGLRLMLAQLDLTYVARDGCLLITSKVEAESKLTLKVYPVQDLVTLDSDFRPAPLTKNGADNSPSPSDMLPHPTFPGMGGTGMGMGRIDDEGDFSELIEMITATVAPTTWDEVGGPGSITGNPHTQAIAISQTDDVHDEIVALLAALRRVRDEQIAAAKPPRRTAPTQAMEQNKPIKVRAFRLMGRTQGMGKSGWRPPTPIVGDLAPPRGAQTGYTNQEAIRRLLKRWSPARRPKTQSPPKSLSLPRAPP